MADAEQPAAKKSDLWPRVAVGVLLAVVALGNIWMGGLAFSAMIALGVVMILWEWAAMHAVGKPWRLVAAAVLLAVSAITHWGEPRIAIGALISAALLLMLLAGRRGGGWLGSGLLYAGLPAVALIAMRQQHDGLDLVLWAMGLVWATDILAYFTGRAIGGPRIWPAASPNKTWAGLIGGMIGAGLFSAAFAVWRDWEQTWTLMLILGALLAVVAQSGDFFESWLKRRAGVKDSGKLLPGHGGIMDRVDGLVPVACLVGLWAVTRPPVQWVLWQQGWLA